MKKGVLIAHPGTQHSFHLVKELAKRNYLLQFYTCFAIRKDSFWYRFLKLMKRDGSLSARVIELPGRLLSIYPVLEIIAIFWKRMGMRDNIVCRKRNLSFQKRIPLRKMKLADAIIGFDTSSYELIRRSKDIGKKFFMEQTIGHPLAARQAMHAVSNAFDGWNQFWSDKEEENIAEEIFEHHLADYIVVPSQFVKRTLVENGVDEKKILINRYGTDTGSFFPADHFPEINPLVFIFVGSISIRKGVPLLLEAWKEISPMNAELWLVGSGTLPENERDALPSSVKVLGKISRVELPTILRKSHIFVLPSYFEGLAISQLEAAACGLPIIATTSSGATDIVEEGITGYVIEPGDKEKLKNRILYMIQNPTEVLNMHIIAKEKYKSWDWSYYCERWISILDSF